MQVLGFLYLSCLNVARKTYSTSSPALAGLGVAKDRLLLYFPLYLRNGDGL